MTIDSAFFYVDKQKLSPEANSYMEGNGIIVRDYGDVSSDVVLLASNQLTSSSSTKGFEGNPKIDVGNDTNIGNGASHAVEFVNDLIWVDPGACCFALYSKLSADRVLLQQSLLALAKTLKVLKGHISLGNARIPNGTRHALDILARIPLWKDGLDYRHGTGHGIGSYLNVHEGPHQISFRPSARNVPLQVAMTVTDGAQYEIQLRR
ncbi:hypothetical protein K7X08_019704 [Anisodus acutangulus]|uniref:Peptidase M24 domain-containing protein n=1 Tax=Anisodus acutangulus TaxID=402998 RepID=A0A9Q1RQV4_9SOLA|nr:hypothetical protein K7X08_019704 [Anisodus acutangulus]